jgi:hypothetical protein
MRRSAAVCVGLVFLLYGSLMAAAPAPAAAAAPAPATASTPPAGGTKFQQIIFEEQKIEGKIRRPQLVLIKADQRPDFPPMIIQGFSKGGNILDFIDESIIENSPYQNAFQFNGNKIRNYVP